MHIDEFCYGVYSLFKNAASSIAVERPFCNRVVIVSKDFEVRFFNSTKNNGIIGIAIEVRDDILKNVKKFISETILQLNKILPKKSVIDNYIKLGIHTTLKVDHINVEELIQKLFSLSIILDKTEDKIIEGFPIIVIKGNTIGYDLRKYEITIAMLASENIELSVTVETFIYMDKMSNAINYINDLINVIVDSIISGY